MKTATLLVLILSNGGYWFGGREGTVGVRFATAEGVPAADLAWELHLSGARLASGTASIEPGDGPAKVTLSPPAVRVRSTMRWTYRLTERATGEELETGDVPIHVFPEDLMEGIAGRVEGKRLVVVGGGDAALSERLRAAGVAHAEMDAAADLALDRPEIVLVGRDALGESPFDQSRLMAHAAAGASVMVFRQSRPPKLLGYRLARREVPRSLEWRNEHPLFAALGNDQLDHLLRDGAEVTAVRLPADEAALELAWWPREVEGEQSAPIDALVVTRTTGTGRLVLCQLPLGDWADDPRAQLMLAGALEYLLTPPQPTPPPSQRPRPEPVARPEVPTITIPGGDQP